ncbi:hypothetical protein GE061_003992 [Apolygus lucorum]|uniref:Uncharacterized protein n=1 Tax=Apolygus lucorum TaxID=248454 RepID=A0A8S9WXE1_APOLU|nr:hypothetical protein GE061_003992 [Apolygus lucorum]
MSLNTPSRLQDPVSKKGYSKMTSLRHECESLPKLSETGGSSFFKAMSLRLELGDRRLLLVETRRSFSFHWITCDSEGLDCKTDFSLAKAMVQCSSFQTDSSSAKTRVAENIDAKLFLKSEASLALLHRIQSLLREGEGYISESVRILPTISRWCDEGFHGRESVVTSFDCLKIKHHDYKL